MLIRPRKIYEKIGEKRLKKSGNSSGGRPMYAQDFETQKTEAEVSRRRKNTDRKRAVYSKEQTAEEERWISGIESQACTGYIFALVNNKLCCRQQ